MKKLTHLEACKLLTKHLDHFCKEINEATFPISRREMKELLRRCENASGLTLKSCIDMLKDERS